LARGSVEAGKLLYVGLKGVHPGKTGLTRSREGREVDSI
jgi:hypothetical protein